MDIPFARSISASGTLGRPFGNRSKGFAFVNSINCSLVSVNTWARAAGDTTSVAAHRQAAVFRIEVRFIVFLLTPKPVVRPVAIPVRRRLEVARFAQVLLHD